MNSIKMSVNREKPFLIIFCAILVSCEVLEIEDLNKTLSERPYCFRFTWLGPKYNEESRFKNATCGDIVRDDKSVPCTHPLVVTNNSGIPDTEYMWNEYRNKPTTVACRLVKGEVCAKFSYTFNGAIENITYLCTKVNIENETAVSSGCYKQLKNGHEIEVCVCESWGGKIPCNRGENLASFFMSFCLYLSVFCCLLITNYIVGL